MPKRRKYEIFDLKTRSSDLGDDYRTYPDRYSADIVARDLEKEWGLLPDSLGVRRVRSEEEA